MFERLFGDGGTAAERLARIRKTGSILDSVSARSQPARAARWAPATAASSTSISIGARNRAAHPERGAQGAQTIELPERPSDVPATFDEHTKLMFDLQVLGFRADVTRVFSMIMSRELSPTHLRADRRARPASRRCRITATIRS